MEGDNGKKSPGLIDIVSRFLSGRRRVTEEEIQELMNAGEEEGLINEEENQMIRSIFALGDTVVREIMVPRTDMACVSSDAGVKEVLAAIIACGHSRIPVYEAQSTTSLASFMPRTCSNIGAWRLLPLF